jgi:hypothetical protein
VRKEGGSFTGRASLRSLEFVYFVGNVVAWEPEEMGKEVTSTSCSLHVLYFTPTNDTWKVLDLTRRLDSVRSGSSGWPCTRIAGRICESRCARVRSSQVPPPLAFADLTRQQFAYNEACAPHPSGLIDRSTAVYKVSFFLARLLENFSLALTEDAQTSLRSRGRPWAGSRGGRRSHPRRI